MTAVTGKMAKCFMKIAFIIPTKDRPEDIRRMLMSLQQQSRCPDQVIIMDAGEKPLEGIVDEYPGLSLVHKVWEGMASASAQRNGGIELLERDMDLVCFFDDDQVLYPDALEKMLEFWDKADRSVGGAVFYDTDNMKPRPGFSIKRSWLFMALGIYAAPGKVARSGWQSMYGDLKETIWVEWMTSGASVVRANLLKEFRFDEFFTGYSYLEDVDFSYSISRRYKLAAVAESKYDHHKSPAGRVNSFEFGKAETRNRLYLVRKHGLSLFSFSLATIGRWLMTMLGGLIPGRQKLLLRGIGNIVGLFV